MHAHTIPSTAKSFWSKCHPKSPKCDHFLLLASYHPAHSHHRLSSEPFNSSHNQSPHLPMHTTMQSVGHADTQVIFFKDKSNHFSPLPKALNNKSCLCPSSLQKSNATSMPALCSPHTSLLERVFLNSVSPPPDLPILPHATAAASKTALCRVT